MSHHTHVFLTNETGDANQNMRFIDGSLNNSDLFSQVDYYTIYGTLNLSTGEYTSWVEGVNSVLDGINSIESLEKFANSLFSQEQWNYLENELDRHIKNHLYWNAARICEQLDGMRGAIIAQKRWTAKMPFGVNDGYFHHFGITDWRGFGDKVKNNPAYAVVVDFHS